MNLWCTFPITLLTVKYLFLFTDLDALSENFKNLYLNKESCDTTLLVMGKEYKAHRTVLMARSSVFSAMFLHETSEKQTGIVTIPDCDPLSFEEFLQFLYSGKLEKPSPRTALHLYETSEKYNVQDLKTFCSDFLTENITVEHVCDVVIMADKYDDSKLLSAAQCLFNKNLNNVLVTSEWDSLMKNNHRLANKLLLEMSTKVIVME